MAEPAQARIIHLDLDDGHYVAVTLVDHDEPRTIGFEQAILEHNLKRKGSQDLNDLLFNAQVEGVLDLLVSQAIAGYSIDNTPYRKALQAALEKVREQYEE